MAPSLTHDSSVSIVGPEQACRRLGVIRAPASTGSIIVNTTVSGHLNPIIRKLERSFTLSDDEKDAASSLPVQVADFKRGQDIVRHGERPTRCFALLEGFTCNYKVTGSGGRQIVAFHIPGDMPDLQSLHLPVLDFSVTALSPCRIAFIQHEAIRHLCERHPRIGAALWRETLLEACVGREWTTNIGQRPGAMRVAHVLCEFIIRMRAAGLVEDDIYKFPLTQSALGDMAGMSSVHVNRCLQEIRAAGLIRLSEARLEVLNWERLMDMADFDAAYLHLGQQEESA